MTDERRSMVAGLAGMVALAAVVVVMLYGCASSAAGCEPSGTFAESGGIRIRAHGAQMCEETERREVAG
jgi:hypothetical protein